MHGRQLLWFLNFSSLFFLFLGNYQLAYRIYKNIHQKFPENVDCLKFLFRLATDLGLKEAQEYSQQLRKAEKIKEEKQMVSQH